LTTSQNISLSSGAHQLSREYLFQLECADPPPQAAVCNNTIVPDTLDHDHALGYTTLSLIDNPHRHTVPMRYLQSFQNNIHH